MLALALAVQPAAGQIKSDLVLPDLLSRVDAKSAQKVVPEGKELALDGPIDAQWYVVGPGDGISVNIWSSAPADYSLTVTPEGFLLVPNIGVLTVSNQTLAAVRDSVTRRALKKFPGSTVSVVLRSPRRVSVQITGQVMNEGMHEMQSMQRVHQLVDEANKLPSTQVTRRFYDVDQQQLRSSASQRHILVQHRNGLMERVDLVKYFLTGESRYNPYLREGDVVFVPGRNSSDNRIGIFGAVARMGSIEYVEGDSLTDLIRLGLGYKQRALPKSALLTRLSPDGNVMDTVVIDLEGIMSGRVPNVSLRPGDRVLVRDVEDPRRGYVVGVEGEVLLPGLYPVSDQGMRLSEVVRLAGGFTPDADLRRATIMRGPRLIDRGEDQLVRERLLAGRTTRLGEDSVSFVLENELRLRGEEVPVSFYRLFEGKDSTQDVVVRNMDRILVPRRQFSVYVFGQVVTPGHVRYVTGKDADFYIRGAGGYTEEARAGDIKVIKGGSRAWLDPGETELEDGDFIWVPKKIHTPPGVVLGTVVQIVGILSGVATVYFVARSTR